MKRFAVCIATVVFAAVMGCKGKPPAATSAVPAESAALVQARNSTAPRIYVSDEADGDLTILDSASNLVVDTIHLGKRPRGIHASPDGKQIYIAVSGSPIAGPNVDESTLPPPDRSADGIAVFNVAQNKVVRTIDAGPDPENFDLSADGKLLYASNEDTQAVAIVDVASGKVIKSLPMGDQPEGVKVSPNGKFVYVTSEGSGTIAVLDTAAGKVITTMKVGHRPRNVAFLKDSSKAYINAENDGAVVLVDAVHHKMLKSIAIGEAGKVKPMFVLLSADDARLFISTGRAHQVCALDTKSSKVGTCVEVGARPWGIALSADGKTLYSANGPSNDVSVVDVATMKVTAKTKAGKGPWGIVVVPRA